VGCGEVALVAIVDAVLEETAPHELTTTIDMQCAEFSPRLSLGSCLELLEHRHCFILDTQQCQPHVVTNIIDQQEEVSLASRCHWCDRPTQILVHELEHVCRMALGHPQKR
jgi:hypothetical protein